MREKPWNDHRNPGIGNRKNPLMRKMAEEMFGMPMAVAICEEEAAYGAALCVRKLILD